MKNKNMLTALVIGITIVLGAGAVLAYQGNPEVQGPNYSPERHTIMQEAFLNQDYQSWSKEMSKTHSKVLNFVNEGNFGTFVEMRNAMVSGDFEKANELKALLGLGQGQQFKNAFKSQYKNGYQMHQFQN